MSPITRLLIGLALVSPFAPAPGQSRDASLLQLTPITSASTDRGRIADRSAWSLTESPDGRFVAFTGFADTIHVYDRRSRAVGTIPNAVVGASELTWSRRGGFISFARRSENEPAVYPWIIPVDAATGRATGPARQLSMRAIARFDDAPSFSPDDRFVVFASNRADSGFVLVAPANGGRERVLYAAPGTVHRALVSPDGRSVYFGGTAATPGSSQALYRVPFSGGRAERLAEHMVFFIGISADGSQLAWYGDGHPRAAVMPSIVIADASGKPLGVVRDVAASVKGWSTKPGVLLGKKGEGTFAMRTVPLAGGPIRSFGSRGPNETPLAWSPDGRFLLAASSLSPTTWLLLSASGDTVRRIEAPPVARVLGDDFAPIWSPDGRMVAYRAASADARRRVSRVMIIDIGAGTARALYEVERVGMLRWRADGQAVRYIDANADTLSLVETTLEGKTTTLARHLTTRSIPWPLTDSTILVVTRDSMYVASSRGFFVRTLRRSPRPQLGYLSNSIQPSPDGRWVAIIEESPRMSSKHVVQIVPTNGDPSRTIAFDLDYSIEDPYFAGDALLFMGNPHTSAGRHTDLFVVPLAGGVPRNLTAADSLTDIDFITVSPDGRTVAYQAELNATSSTRVIDIDVSTITRQTPNGAK
jgi:TolB protein